ncbi:MAG: DNA-directed RNA polymerase subunit beta', partial [Candidatus Abawacabacteria bacterium RIFCSPHIGHO2_01_FULL_46_8]
MAIVTRPVSARAKAAPGLEKGKIPSVFDLVTVSVASPEKILEWSYGEVTKPETINYRTQKPERDGLFCERIFGPSKNWECYCGKYKKLKHKSIVCDKCGVEVTRSSVRRERMGHIRLAVPVTHIWFLRSTPSGLGLLLNLSVKSLEQVVYFAGYIIKSVDDTARKDTLEELKKDFQTERKTIGDEYKKRMKELGDDNKKIAAMQTELNEELEALTENYHKAKTDLDGMMRYQILSELQYREHSMRFGHVFTAGTGAEALRDCVQELDLIRLKEELTSQLKQSSGQKRKKLMKRLMVVRGMEEAKIKPEWMILTTLPVIPPDLRPMVQLDGGRFATSDLNDLYRRVINRNNRLRRLLDIGAPEVICRNEKRMLQEAVDALINNAARPGKAITRVGAGRLQLKSLSDMLKGKQGRFRQNLLGKRVDYSGRSVIVVGPQLKLHQCGLPKKMALELFKPFVIGKLLEQEIAYNIKNAERLIEWGKAEVWDALEEITKDNLVLLNRAPTLHRLGIQAFQPVLIEGKAIQLHPLVCAAFNADFDGDQMAVHVPLSKQAQWEARNIMLATRNLLKPSEGKPIVTASQDMVLGCYYLTRTYEHLEPKEFIAANFHEAVTAYRTGYIKLQDRIKARINGEIVDTTMGRMIFNSILPEELGYRNETMTKKALGKVIAETFEKVGLERAALLADEIKRIGFKFATKSGITISVNDIAEPVNKPEIVAEASEKIKTLQKMYRKGLMTNDERYMHTINVWTEVKNKLAAGLEGQVPTESPLYSMIDSGARGNWGQMTQLGAMKGLVVSPSGKTIELPIISSFKEGFKPLEYFIATHGGRKGKTDTALRTAGAGYLTRRLVDTVQEMIVREYDCGNEEHNVISKAASEELGESLEARIFGRTLAEDLKDKQGKVLLKQGISLGIDECRLINEADIKEVTIRSILTCRTEHGVCQQCYGRDLASNEQVELGTAVGIIAAQSIGEPGTQLTMRTFHSGGVAGMKDITQGLPRVEELFEARTPKTEAVMAPFSGKVSIEKKGNK